MQATEKPNVSPEMYNILLKNHLENVPCNNDLKECTRGQWTSERRKVFQNILFILGDFMPKTIFKCYSCEEVSVWKPSNNYSDEIWFGKRRNIARKSYSSKHLTDVKECGSFVDPENPCLCASPDGLIGSDGLIEIKCPYTQPKILRNSVYLIKNTVHEDGSIHLPSIHKSYYQIQGQLNIANRKWCDLFFWAEKIL
ncbi:yqaJ domain-containing protein [Trichonephila clavipes]|nr:yqaJ domain-containing protein [Trichonephila clavipes]